MNQRIRSPRTDPMERRQQILDAAIEVFGRQGYRQGSLKDVADVVGLTVQGVLHHFPTKESLLRATLDRRQQARSERLAEIAETEGAIAMFRFILTQNDDHPGFRRLYVTLAAESTDPEHPAHEYFVERYRSSIERARAAAVGDVAAGRLRAGLEPSVVAEHLVALSDGLQLQRLMRSDMDLLASYDAVVAALLPD